jgi:hypothetical protein
MRDTSNTPERAESIIDPVNNTGAVRPKNTHIFAKELQDHYVEPRWCSTRLFDVERFPGIIMDPFAGWGRCVAAARTAGYRTIASDIVDRTANLCAEPGFTLDAVQDFLTVDHINPDVSILGNPPFDDAILQHIIKLDPIRACLIWPLARLVAASSWLGNSPLSKVLMMTPRPAMPPGSYLAAGKKPEGARVEHCWLVFERGYHGPIELRWLRRDSADDGSER